MSKPEKKKLVSRYKTSGNATAIVYERGEE
jgi:hypothetical protein